MSACLTFSLSHSVGYIILLYYIHVPMQQINMYVFPESSDRHIPPSYAAMASMSRMASASQQLPVPFRNVPATAH